jgi:hypothetical protein
MVINKISPEFSLKGWDYKKWIAGNHETIKIVIGAVIALSVSNPELLPINLSVGAGAIIVKAVLDIVDFYSKEVKL